jgi:hypothetical protein
LQNSVKPSPPAKAGVQKSLKKPPRLAATQLQSVTGCSVNLERTFTSLIECDHRRTIPAFARMTKRDFCKRLLYNRFSDKHVGRDSYAVSIIHEFLLYCLIEKDEKHLKRFSRIIPKTLCSRLRPAFKNTLAFVVIIVVLLLRPEGPLGVEFKELEKPETLLLRTLFLQIPFVRIGTHELLSREIYRQRLHHYPRSSQ